MSVTMPPRGEHTEAASFIADPTAFFEKSYTAMHSLPLDMLDRLQREGLALRFASAMERIAMLRRLAERQGISSIVEIGDVVPLLFEHTMYKSYPASLLEQQRFDQLTLWLDKLTSVDLAEVDASQCDSIDAWLETLVESVSVDPAFSSGTSGTMSFIPWSTGDITRRCESRRVSELQTFGEAPTREQLESAFHHISVTNRSRGDYMGPVFSRGEPGHSHLFEPNGESADLLWLAARLRLAAARGDATRVSVPESLLRRKGELERAHATAAERKREWARSIVGLAGQRVLWSGQPFLMYQLARDFLDRDIRCEFAPGSVLILGGGFKGNELPDDWLARVEEFVGIRAKWVYAMVEVGANHVMCGNGRYHLQPWVIPFVLDPFTSELMPRSGVQRGRIALFDLSAESRWGGVITGDEAEVAFDEPCGCGATTPHLSANIERLSEKRGGDDKILCTASPQAHAEAMQYLVGQ